MAKAKKTQTRKSSRLQGNPKQIALPSLPTPKRGRLQKGSNQKQSGQTQGTTVPDSAKQNANASAKGTKAPISLDAIDSLILELQERKKWLVTPTSPATVITPLNTPRGVLVMGRAPLGQIPRTIRHEEVLV